MANVYKFENQVDPCLIFESFIVGSGNELCYAASRAVADKPGEIYNPLYLYGARGIGKTHIINAVANSLIDRGYRHIACIKAEQLIYEYIQAIRNDTLEKFRHQYCQVDVLILDDIECLMGKEKIQEELSSIFNRLYEEEKQIILTSCTSPCELKGFIEPLKSSLNRGLVVDIQAPDLETRRKILSSKAELAGVQLDEDVVHLLASRIANNVRELESALTRLIDHAPLTGESIDLAFAHSVLCDLPHEDGQPKFNEDIQKKLAAYFNIETTQKLK